LESFLIHVSLAGSLLVPSAGRRAFVLAGEKAVEAPVFDFSLAPQMLGGHVSDLIPSAHPREAWKRFSAFPFSFFDPLSLFPALAIRRRASGPSYFSLLFSSYFYLPPPSSPSSARISPSQVFITWLVSGSIPPESLQPLTAVTRSPIYHFSRPPETGLLYVESLSPYSKWRLLQVFSPASSSLTQLLRPSSLLCHSLVFSPA